MKNANINKVCMNISLLIIKYLKQAHFCIKNDKCSVLKLLVSFPNWLIYNTIKKDSLNERIPWLTFGSIKFLNKYIKSNIRIFEYGSGGSTLFFCDKNCIVTSVEHDKLWFERMWQINNSINWNGILKEPTNLDFKNVTVLPRKNIDYDEETELNPNLYISNWTKYWNKSFQEYVSSIDIFPDESFDIILIDGRARQSCWRHCRNKLKKSGLLILDNSERKNYSNIKKEIRELGWVEFYFYGPGPFVCDFWETIIWQKKNEYKTIYNE